MFYQPVSIMHIFPALIGKLRRDVIDDKEVLRDWDFRFIHSTVDSDSGCLEASVITVYCAAFDCNANSSKKKVACSTTGFVRFENICFDCHPDQRRCSSVLPRC